MWLQLLCGSPPIASAEQDDGYGYTISDVTARQRWPWERKVDIDFVLTKPAGAPADQLVRIGVVASNDTSEVAVSSGSLRGTAVFPEGGRRIVWDPMVDYSAQSFSHLKFYLSVVSTNEIPEYMVIDLTTGAVAYKNDLLAEQVNTDRYKTTKMAFRYAEPRSFLMGEGLNIKQTTLTKGFYVGVFEVTQAQWKSVQGAYPDSFFTVDRDMRPAEKVRYDDIRGATLGTNWPFSSTVDANSFLGVLRNRTGFDGLDLPTEAQWEYACRAGTTTYYNDGNTAAPYDDVSLSHNESNAFINVLGRYRHNGGYIDGVTAPESDCGPTNGTAVVGSYLPNPWGLYDMHGNVWEVCLDWYTQSALLTGGEDPPGPEEASGTPKTRTRRGGSWSKSSQTYYGSAQDCRSASRNNVSPTAPHTHSGLRLVINLP